MHARRAAVLPVNLLARGRLDVLAGYTELGPAELRAGLEAVGGPVQPPSQRAVAALEVVPVPGRGTAYDVTVPLSTPRGPSPVSLLVRVTPWWSGYRPTVLAFLTSDS